MMLVNGLDLYRGTKSCLNRTDLNSDLEVIPVPDKTVMWLDIHLNKQITIRCTIIACLTIPFYAKSHTIVYSARYMHRYFPFHARMT